MIEKSMSVREAAQQLQVTMKYVYDLIYMGRLAAEKVRRQWRIPSHAVEARLKQRGE
jgi:excisionase family DNA binding protein